MSCPTSWYCFLSEYTVHLKTSPLHTWVDKHTQNWWVTATFITCEHQGFCWQDRVALPLHSSNPLLSLHSFQLSHWQSVSALHSWIYGNAQDINNCVVHVVWVWTHTLTKKFELLCPVVKMLYHFWAATNFCSIIQYTTSSWGNTVQGL